MSKTNTILCYVIAKLPQKMEDKIINQKTNTLVFQDHKETDAKTDVETPTLETNRGELKNIF